MGVIKLFSSSSGDSRPNRTEYVTEIKYINSTPDPKKFQLMNLKLFDDYLVVKVKYPDCTNYEGVKIMVYERNHIADSLDDILKHNQGALDPHFGINPNFISPIARFEPTDRGWDMAVRFCKVMDI